MQQKCLKSDIFVNENYFCDSVEQAIDLDFTLPDFCSDISKIFKCQAVPRITSKSVNGNTVVVDGNVIITVLYCDKDEKFCSYETVFPFSKSAEMQRDTENCNVVCKIKCEYLNCRAVSGRKVDIHGALSIFLKVFKRKCNEIISDIDDELIELKRMTAPATTPMGYAEKYLLLEEDIPLGNGLPSIQNVIKVNSSVNVQETKIINDKVVVKGELILCVLYCPENSETPQIVKSRLPYSQIIDIDGITDTCECDCKAEICSLDIKQKLTSNGEVRCFAVAAKLLLCCEVYCCNDISIIADAFSRKYEAEIKRSRVSFKRIAATVQECYNCKKSIEFDLNINSIIDLWCSLQNCRTKFDEDTMTIYGTLLADMIICDENNVPIYVEKPIDFEYNYPYKSENGTAFCEPDIEVITCSFTIISPNRVDILAELGINTAIYEKHDISLICELNIREDKPLKRKDDTAMVICFLDKDESIWDVARKYSASVEEILKINNLEATGMEHKNMIFVPIT